MGVSRSTDLRGVQGTKETCWTWGESESQAAATGAGFAKFQIENCVLLYMLGCVVLAFLVSVHYLLYGHIDGGGEMGVSRSTDLGSGTRHKKDAGFGVSQLGRWWCWICQISDREKGPAMDIGMCVVGVIWLVLVVSVSTAYGYII